MVYFWQHSQDKSTVMARQRKDDVGHEGRSSTTQHKDQENPHGMQTASHLKKNDRSMPSKQSHLRHDQSEVNSKEEKEENKED
jgi:hypothetical protein